MKCGICEIGCDIAEGRSGRCRMYTNNGSAIVEKFPDSYMTIMPVSIETMPMLHFCPRGKFLQISTIGCNFSCGGCISEILTRNAASVSGALRHNQPEEMIRKALDLGCTGIIFCLNDPIVSHHTFLSLGKAAKKAGLLVGCSSNTYYTEEALKELIPCLDFINVGLKGSSDRRYQECGVKSAEPVFRNIKILHQAGVHVEVSAMYIRGAESEIKQAAMRVAQVSRSIPFQVMRFVPFGDADIDLEPSILESERACDRLREILDYVYLFNSPGTEYLNTNCPECGKTIFSREFYGPMGTHTISCMPEGTCSCGYKVPYRGEINQEDFKEKGMMGGYRYTRALEIIHAVLVCLGVDSEDELAGIWSRIIRDQYILGIHDRIQSMESYLGIISDLGARSGRQERASELITYLKTRTEEIRSKTRNCKGPDVYYSMGSPLFALNAERFETTMVEYAGGQCVNKEIRRAGKPGVNISEEEFRSFNPEYIFISGFLSAPSSDYIRICTERDLIVTAIEKKQVYTLPPGWDFGSPRWILGLMLIANTLHPEIFEYDLKAETENYYREFYGIEPEGISPNRSFYKPAGDRKTE